MKKTVFLIFKPITCVDSENNFNNIMSILSNYLTISYIHKANSDTTEPILIKGAPGAGKGTVDRSTNKTTGRNIFSNHAPHIDFI